MRLSRPKPKRSALSLTSLIDVIFLLLLFFMLSTSFSRFVEMPIASSASGGGSGEAEETQVFVVELGANLTKLNREDIASDQIIETIKAQIDERANIFLVAREGLLTDELVGTFAALKQIENAQVMLLNDRVEGEDG